MEAPTQPGESVSPFLITHERGPMTRQVRNAVLAEGGEAAWSALLATVSPACRARFSRPIGYFEWVESPLALELHRARQAQLGEEFVAARGEEAAREMLSGAHAWILRIATPGMLIQALPRLLAFYYRGPEGRVLTLEGTEADLELRADGYFEAWYDAGIGTFLKVALEMAGAKGPEVDHRRIDGDTHRYHLRWSR